ncbi:ABC transporter permease [Nocardioides alcanivorans]|uniref:ABC transporter permease n=1 Tax=Nocardioides alcanivorans TaxID=2897352 RepID=UPI001F26202F|nr:ABC transporter permease [Nocardioides alcanivorans]
MTITTRDGAGRAETPIQSVPRIAPAVRQQLVFGAVVLALFLGSMPFLPQMRDPNYLSLQLATYAAVFIMALGQTVVVLQVGFDVSIGALQGLTGALVFVLIQRQVSDPALIVGCLVLTFVFGAFVNGLLITKLKINFIIVTLAMFTILPSISQILLSGTSQPIYSPALDWMANGTVLGVRTPILLAAAVMALLWILLNTTVFGRQVYATGSNREAARLAGVPVDAITMACYGICALCAGLAGLMLVGSIGAADPASGLGNEFFALTAVLLGGTRISGGQGGWQAPCWGCSSSSSSATSCCSVGLRSSGSVPFRGPFF